MSELVAAALGALIAYYFDIRQTAKEREAAQREEVQRRRLERANIATALLNDLRMAEVFLRQIFGHERAANWKGQRPRMLYDLLGLEVRRFASTSVQAIYELYRRLDEVFEVMRSVQAGEVQANANAHYIARVKAGFALQAIPAAKAALLAEGGEWTDPIPLEVITPPQLPTVPPVQFPQVAAPGHVLPDELK